MQVSSPPTRGPDLVPRKPVPKGSLNIPYKANTAEYRKAWKELNPDKCAEYLKRAHPNKKHQMREKRYGISKDQYEAWLLKQDHCEICKASFETERPNIDHCHDTNKIRGLLCNSCNRALGWFKDSPEVLHNAQQYLKKHGKERI